MAAILKISDIDEAIANLRYRNPETLKYKLIHSIRNYYADESSPDSLQNIGADELVKALWDTGDDPAILKAKRKNFSSVKSGINADLKKLYQEGNNPQGVIIGQNNLFDMSDEAKDKALGSIADVFKEKGTDIIGKITEVLSAVNEILSNSGSFSNMEGGLERADRIKGLIFDLSRKIGRSLPGDLAMGMAGGSGSEMTRDGVDEREAENQPGASWEDAPAEIVEEVIEDDAGEIEEVEEAEQVVEDGPADEANVEIEEIAAYDDMTEVEENEPDISMEPGEDGELLPADMAADEAIEILEEVTEEPAQDEAFPDGPEEERTAAAAEAEEHAAEGLITGGEEIEEAGGLQEGAEEVEAGSAEILAESPEDEIVLEEAEDVADEIEISPSVVAEELEEIADYAGPEEVEGDEAPVEGQDAFAEEILEDDEILDTTAEETEIIEDELQSKAEFLAKLAEAAKVLEKLGPELNDNIYSEEEIKEKAKLLSEEFDRELSIREKFFNQHILIKGGEYMTGSKSGGKNELPGQKVHLPEFYIGKFPVTNNMFEIFVEKTGYRTSAEKRGYGYVYVPRARRVKDSATGLETFIWSSHLQYKKMQGACWHQPGGPGSSLYNKRRHPVVQISMEDARAFAAWTGKRLPTEKEWEAAVRTSMGYIYPWGNEWKENACNVEKSCFGDTTPVDHYIEFSNDSGVADSLGNVLEWTLDLWETHSPGEKNTDIYVVKGGSWISDAYINLSSRFPMDRNTSSNILGFRCVAI